MGVASRYIGKSKKLEVLLFSYLLWYRFRAKANVLKLMFQMATEWFNHETLVNHNM